VHDAIEIEQHGIPCVAVGTTPFVATMAETTRVCGVPGHRFAVIGHPIGSLGEEELQARADEAVEQVLAILLERQERG
jgi:hypothetical protein